MKILSILTISTIFFSSLFGTEALEQIDKEIRIPSESKQLLFVSTPNWNARNGILQRYERHDENWSKIGKEIKIILGRNGLGWGLGLHTVPNDAQYIKKEGDGKAPAGLFSLGNGFGYQDFKINFPYQAYKRTDHCVDDSNSQFYNTIVDSKSVKKDYKSFEHMKLQNHLYRYGITVQHNPNNIAQSGSCIFIHIKNNTGKGTAGCTAMKENELINILEWLQKDKKPLLLQLPQKEIEKKIHDNSLN